VATPLKPTGQARVAIHRAKNVEIPGRDLEILFAIDMFIFRPKY
jgi:hypothetical protein